MKKLLLLRFLFIILWLDCWCVAESNLASDRRALLAIRIAIGAQFLPWNLSDSSPCNWTGVTCLHNRVVELYLQGNFFSGEIPEFLFNLRDLVSLNLAHNHFTGSISPIFDKLTRLIALHLEGNQLNGSIPYLNLASLKHFNVSFNNFTGLIPETLSGMPASSFEGNSLCGKPLLPCNGSSVWDNYKLLGFGIVGIVSGCFFGCFYQRKIPKQGGIKATVDLQHTEVDVKCEALKEKEKVKVSKEEGMSVSSNTTAKSRGEPPFVMAKGEASGNVDQRKEVSVKGVTDTRGATAEAVQGKSSSEFDLEDLLRASAEVLGTGAFGTTYKAIFETGRTLAIKRLKDFNVSEKEFEDMVKAIEKMNNPSLVPIRAYYYSDDNMLLVYEYMHMGSLYARLHGDRGGGRSTLNLETRTSIALGAARAILHIHSIDPSACHGNIKSSNVFLIAPSSVRLSEFGLASVAGSSNIDGYLAPEMTENGNVSQKADVYSFGVLLLELITGKDPTESYLKDEGLDLPRWMLSAVNDEWTSAVFDVVLLQYENVEEIMLRFLDLAFSCTAQNPDGRPSMAKVTEQIKKLSSSILKVDRDPTMSKNIFGQIYMGPNAWKIHTRRNRELQQTFNSRRVAKGLVLFGNIPDVYDFEDLLRASAEPLGKGTLGPTYKVKFETGRTICVKRLKKSDVKGEEFQEMAEAIGKMNHEFLMCLRGYYHGKDENLLLLQDYMPTGSLSSLLHGNKESGRRTPNWATRCSIALGVARAVEYIHSKSPAMCHGKIKSSNILLTKTLEARVADFGLANVAGDYSKDGYRAPEVIDANNFSQKADAYSFGVLLMELLTGRAPSHSRLDEKGVDLPRWVQSVVKSEWTSEVFRFALLPHQIIEEDMVQMLQIALSCTAEDPDKRPSMTTLKFQIKKLVRPTSKVGESDRSFKQMKDRKLRFGHIISISDDGQ